MSAFGLCRIPVDLSRLLPVLAFGHDEETGGARGATSVNKHLQSLYGNDGIAMIVDEGGMGLDSIYGTDFALPGMAEKGYGVRATWLLNTVIAV